MSLSRTAQWWAITIALAAIRLALAARLPLGDDEGYYWVWSRHLAAGYYDHPPLVAWMVALASRLLGDSALAIRLPFVVCGTLAALALRALVEETTADARLACRSSLLFQIVPVFFALGFMIIPDNPLVLFWLLAGRALWRLGRRADLTSALLLGVALGGAALSKYVAALLAAPLAVYVLAAPRVKWIALAAPQAAHALPAPRAKRIALMATATAIALVVFSPVVWWNADHDWASFRYQFVGRHHGAHLEAGRLLLYVGSQALFLSPLVLALIAAAVFCVGPWSLSRDARGERLLWWLGAPAACLFLAVGGFTDFKPNWAAPGYATLVALALGGLSQWQARALGLVRGIGTANMAIAVAFTAVSAFHLIRPMIPFPRGADPTVDMDGWPAIAARVREAAARLESKGGAAPFIAAGRYQLASRLEFYLPRHPEVISLNPGRDAYDDWQDLARLEGRNFVFVASDRFPTPPDRLARCESARVYSRMTTAVRRNERFGVTIYQAWGYRPGPVAAP